LGQVECEATLPFLPRFMLKMEDEIKTTVYLRIKRIRELMEEIDKKLAVINACMYELKARSK